jgi:predicted permease
MRAAWSRLRALIVRRQLDRRLDDEVQAHLDLLIEDNLRRGMTAEQARLAARREFGAIEPMKEAYRDRYGFRWIEEVGQDLRYGLRGLRKNPGFAVVAIATLALGIGANTAIFTLLDAVMLRPLPVARPHELVMAQVPAGSQQIRVFTASQFNALRADRHALADLAAFRPLSMRVSTRGDVELTPGQLVSGTYHALLGVPMMLGRGLTEADDADADSSPAVVISYGYWQRRFGGDPHAVGRTIDIEGRAFTIVGVTARDFFGTQPGQMVDITVPLGVQPLLTRSGRLTGDFSEVRWLYVIGRLAPGVSRERATAVLAVAFDQLPAPRVSTNRPLPARRFTLVAGAQGLNELRDRFAVPLNVLMAMVGVVLMIACANLATLLLARAGARRQEIGIRLAIGASRGRLLRQLLAESLLLSCLGGAVGVAMAVVTSDLLVQIMSRGTNPIDLALEPNGRTLLFTLLVSVVAGVAFGIAPALRSTRQGALAATRATRSAVEGRTRWDQATIAAQAALCVVLLVEAGLFARSLASLRAVDTGFSDAGTLLLMNVRPAAGGNQPARAANLVHEFYERLGGLGLRSATFSMDVPLGDLSSSLSISVPGRPPADDGTRVYQNFVGPRFFETMGIALRGRDVRVDDDERAPLVAVVSEEVARKYFPDESAVGKRVRTGQEEFEIVAVAADVRSQGMRAAPTPMIYFPYFQHPSAVGGLVLALRTAADGEGSLAALGRDVRTMSRDVVIADVRTLAARVDASLVRERVVAILSSVFGALALLLGCIGLYGTLAYAVVRRTAEFGVRMALGATARTLVRMVIGESLRPVVVGIVVGLPLALAAGRLSENLLFGISGTDPASYAIATTALLIAAVCAAFLPARRAASITPIVALRNE